MRQVIVEKEAEGAMEHNAPTFLIAAPRQKTAYLRWKRLFDIVLSLSVLIILFLPLVLIALIVFLDCPKASPIYVQKRIGKDGREFSFYKFRSMVPHADQMLEELMEHNEMDGPVFKMKHDPRITPVGRFIRRASIDELPQLVNILKGDMSFVGPRPALPGEVSQYTAYQCQRLSVIPGLTCYWQVQPGRNQLSFDEWLELDLKYIQERSFRLDIRLIFQTFGAVLGMEGE